MPKKDIHPKWFTDTKVKVNGEVVMTVSSTKEELNVDLWSEIIRFLQVRKKLLIQKAELSVSYVNLIKTM